jgi:PAS domain S-box-containing protein
MHGLLAILNESDFLLDIHVEYLDIQRRPLGSIANDLENIYAKKYKDVSFDTIILSDNPALNFVLPRRDRLFSKVPIVFCGINDFKRKNLLGHDNITGVNQHVDVKRTIELALKIKPNISHVLAISDTTSTGRVNKEKFAKDIKAPQFKKIHFELMDNFSLDSLKSRLGGLSIDSAVLVLRLHQTKEGRQFTPEEYLNFITDWCNVPVFKLWSPEYNDGVVGGVMESGRLQGELAAQYALRILKGEPASSIPVTMQSPNVTILNYRQLKRFNIPDSRVPKDAVIVNYPESVFFKYRSAILTIAAIIVLLTTMTIALFVNILSKKKAEKKANEALLRQRELIKASNVGLWDWDLKTNKVSYSREWKQQIGYEEHEIGDTIIEWRKRVHPDDLEHTLEKVNLSIARASNDHQVEFRFKHRDGSYRWILTQASVLRDKSGKPIRMIGSHIDISDRKQDEKELCEYREHLEELVLERTAQLEAANKELSEYREHLEELVRGRTAQLEAANKEMHAFTYTVSHDLRAPLRHIDGFIELLQKKTKMLIDEQGRHYMTAISGAARKMGLLIDDLLSFSQMGRHIQAFQKVALEELVRDILRELEADTAGRKIDWRIDDLPVVSGDKAMLRIVLVNLISNALKFTRSREKAAIEIGSLADPTSETMIFVRDNGVGFDMTYADKLFGVFQRLHHTDEFEGTGIGLAIVQRIIARHGGRIWAEGEPDQGAAFYFALPRKRLGDGDERP